jgi:hypothetical protein
MRGIQVKSVAARLESDAGENFFARVVARVQRFLKRIRI